MPLPRFKFLILGAGPSGLAFAHTLLAHGETSFLVLEKETEAGGLCRSIEFDGAPLDIGGGHFLDVRRREVLEMLFRFMPEDEWNRHHRVARIRLQGIEVDHPLEANLWQFPLSMQADYIEAIAQAGCIRGEPMPSLFEDWVKWKFGARIADEYMLAYNRKIWRMDLNRLGTYWLYKLPDVSFRDTLVSCLRRRSSGALPAHDEFYYPKRYGYGEVWRRMASALGDRLHLSTPVNSIDVANRIINGEYQADIIVNSIPWPAWTKTATLPAKIKLAIGSLVSVPINVDYKDEHIDSPSHWIYEPDEKISHHRILVRSNFLPGSRGCWTETNALASPPTFSFRHHNEYAYPVNTVNKPVIVETIHRWARSARVLPLGRWGCWEHINSDIAVSRAIQTAEAALKGSL